MGQVRNPRVGRQKRVGNVNVIKGDGKMRKMRCPRCKKLAYHQRNARGELVWMCMCGAEIKSTRM